MLTSNQITYLFVITLIASLISVVVALWRAQRLPIVESKEVALTKRVLKLETEQALLQTMLVEKQAEIVELRERVHQLELELERTQRERSKRPNPKTLVKTSQDDFSLVLAIGNDHMLTEDLMLLRGLPNVRLEVINDVTAKALETILGDRRAAGAPIENLHLSVHANPTGVKFSDRVVDALWLSDRLDGVKVLVIAGCESTGVGRLLAVVPFVVAMRAPIDNSGAALFTKAFWQALSEGSTPDEALKKAMSRSTSSIREMVDVYRRTPN
jgi:hypothetical protein